MPEKVSVVTLGCAKNSVDSEMDIKFARLAVFFHSQEEGAPAGRLPEPIAGGEIFISGCSAETGEIRRRVRITHAYEYDLSGEGIA